MDIEISPIRGYEEGGEADPDERRADRIFNAKTALAAYERCETDPDCPVLDLMVDLAHLADETGEDGQKWLAMATRYHREERDEYRLDDTAGKYDDPGADDERGPRIGHQ